MFFFFFFDKNSDLDNESRFDDVEFAQKGNKGEWSELYAMYKILSDQNLNPINDVQKECERLRLPILSVHRFTEEDLSVEYRVLDNNSILVTSDGISYNSIEKDLLDEKLSIMLTKIIEGSNDSTFAIPELDSFRKVTKCPKIKCYAPKLKDGNQDKSDLYIVIHDAVTGQTPTLGFSIKSEIGNPPTLLNAGNLTNFIYRLSKPLPTEKVEKINSMQTKRGHADIQGRTRAIIDSGVDLVFDSLEKNRKGECVFLENLILIDGFLPEILAKMLVLSYTEETRRLDELADILTDKNPLNIPMRTNRKPYEAKIKRFVTDVALGMVPSKPWEAEHQATGILVVTGDGKIDCYHVIYKSALEKYLYHDLKFETPSTSRYGFGSIVVGDDGNQYFSLNLQLRFIK